MIDLEEKIKLLKEYFEKREDVVFAYVFGSYAKGRVMSESDIDIAVYLRTEEGKIEIEADKDYPGRNRIWSDVEDITGENTDLVALNSIPATLADEIIKTGKEIIIKDRGIWLEYMLRVTAQAEDFREFARDFYEIKKRSASLSEQDKHSLLKKIDFLEGELNETPYFKALTFPVYEENRKERRNIERWVENVIMATIDIAKIILASEKRMIPDKYKDTLLSFGLFIGLDETASRKFSGFAGLRNFIAHEYLDMRFGQIKEFITESETIYKKLLGFVHKLL